MSISIPELPRSPIDMDAETKAFLKSLGTRLFYEGRYELELKSIAAIGVINNILYVLGTAEIINTFSGGCRWIEIQKDIKSGNVKKNIFEPWIKEPILFLGLIRWFITLGFYELLPHVRRKSRQYRERREKYEARIEEIKKENRKDIDSKIKDIKIFQGTIEEVEKDLGVTLKRIDINHPEKFIEEKDSYWLRIRAYNLGADAIVHYQPGSSIGTPVKIVKRDLNAQNS